MRYRIFLFAMALAAAGSAHALSPDDIAAARLAGTLRQINIAGGATTRLALAAYVHGICDPASFDVFFDGSRGNNHRAYSCNLRTAVASYAAGAPMLVTKRDLGGSTNGINPVATATAQAIIAVDSTCTRTANASPATDIQLPSYACPNTTSLIVDAGIADLEPALLQQQINLPNGTTALTYDQYRTLDIGPFVQALFGVVVNKKAYRALQEAQGYIGAGAAIDEDPAKQPSLTSQFVRAALTTPGLSAFNRRGWNVVIPTSVDANVETKAINICRQVEGSATQAASNVFFANNPCGSGTAARGVIGVAGSSGSTPAPRVTGSTTVAELTSTGNLENCLGGAAPSVEAATGTPDNTAYGLAVIGRENNPLANGGDKGYRYVKLDGIAPIRTEAKEGRYPFFYESTLQWNSNTIPFGSEKEAFLRAMRSSIGSIASLQSADSDTQQALMASPGTYSGPYASLIASDQAFASRVSRTSLNSCSPARVTK